MLKKLESIALATYLSDFPDYESFDTIVEVIERSETWSLPDSIVPWEPFEDWDTEALANQIVELRDEIYKALHPAKTAADMYYVRDRTEQSDDLLNIGRELSKLVKSL